MPSNSLNADGSFMKTFDLHDHLSVNRLIDKLAQLRLNQVNANRSSEDQLNKRMYCTLLHTSWRLFALLLTNKWMHNEQRR